MKITENIHMLEIKSAFGAIYPVLLSDGSNLVLIDTGFPGQTGLIADAISNAGFSPGKLTGIVLTHQDLDHTGGINELRLIAPEITTSAHADEAPYIDGSKTPVKIAAAERKAYLTHEEMSEIIKRKENALKYAAKIDKILRDGDTLPALGAAVMHIPGHTPGHICLYLPKEGVLVAGDALNINNGGLSGPNPVYTYDMELALKSLQKLLALDIKTVLTYHGGMFAGDVHNALKSIVS